LSKKSQVGVQTEFFAPQGGLDIVTPPFLVRNGAAISALNFEVDIEAGYSRIAGYDRYVNGLTASQQFVRLATVVGIPGHNAALSGQILRGLTSGAQMTFVVKASGSSTGLEFLTTYGGDTAAYVSEVSGTFVIGEEVEVLGMSQGATYVIVSPPTALPGATAEERAASRIIADDTLRTAWHSPSAELSTGTAFNEAEKIMGLFVLDDRPVAIRYSYSSDVMIFLEPSETLMVSGVPVPNNKNWVVRNIGLPSSGVYNPSTENAIRGANAQFEFVVNNLGSNDAVGAQVDRAFGVSGTSRAFIYYNGTLDFITTGMAIDTPSHLAVHGNRLFLSFGSSLQYSQVGNPKSWTPVLGAGEINTGAAITGLMSLTGESEASALLVSTQDRLFILYGDSDSTFQLIPFSGDTGALPGTLQWMGKALFQNAFGLTTMTASQQFGAFENSVFSGSVKPFVDARRNKAVASMLCRNKNQYRIFFEDGSGLYCSFRNGKPSGIFPVQFPHVVTCAWSCIAKGTGVLEKGEELMLVGTADGEVLRLDVGWSFNGQAIPWNLRLAFNHMRSPRLLKHFKRSVLETQTGGYVKLQIGYDLDYRSEERDVTPDAYIYSPESGSNQYWQNAVWNQGRYDVTTTEPNTVDTPGSGVNLSLRMQGDDKTTQPFTITGAIIHYVFRRLKR
jgi:hypothetical protein